MIWCVATLTVLFQDENAAFLREALPNVVDPHEELESREDENGAEASNDTEADQHRVMPCAHA